jgi:predicted alpha/beta-fold hydrolase
LIILVSFRPSQSQPIGYLKKPTICPLPVKTFTGRKEILDKMCQYFNSGHNSQHVFVLHGLGGSGKSQLAFKFLDDAQTNQWYGFTTYVIKNL